MATTSSERTANGHRNSFLHHPRWHELRASTTEILRASSSEGGRTAFLRRMFEYPMEYQAARWIDSLPIMSIPALLEQLGQSALEFPKGLADRHLWNLGALEQALLTQVVRGQQLRTCFEIGTFDGSTTQLLAGAVAPQDGHVFTLDLPPADYDQTLPPEGYEGGDRVGERFADAPEAARITQLWGDSLTFDFTPWKGTVDLMFVDGAHDYPHGLADSRSALELVRPGGWIFWDDFGPRWHGLVRGIAEATDGLRVCWVEGTSLAVLRV
jgi:predicted O-methyltransferase YrrM